MFRDIEPDMENARDSVEQGRWITQVIERMCAIFIAPSNQTVFSDH